MLSKHHLASLACALILGGCASAPPAPPPVAKAPVTVVSLMAEAEAALTRHNIDQAMVMLSAAAVLDPKQKAPRLRMAQLQFDRHSYGEAIFHAQAAVDRDPNDMLAHSIIAASGLRVSSQALADLAARNDVSGSVRSEAQDLVKVVRMHIKGDIIVPKAAPDSAVKELGKSQTTSKEAQR